MIIKAYIRKVFILSITSPYFSQFINHFNFSKFLVKSQFYVNSLYCVFDISPFTNLYFCILFLLHFIKILFLCSNILNKYMFLLLFGLMILLRPFYKFQAVLCIYQLNHFHPEYSRSCNLPKLTCHFHQ